mmetsp:Transcript_33599/g.66568  ORF Transcript_33599/g.66568 Transcript_33599/m.66568 type:complete len:116 (+) Transcript_33599:369-716(+)
MYLYKQKDKHSKGTKKRRKKVDKRRRERKWRGRQRDKENETKAMTCRQSIKATNKQVKKTDNLRRDRKEERKANNTVRHSILLLPLHPSSQSSKKNLVESLAFFIEKKKLHRSAS